MKKPTFAQARAHLLQALKEQGWDVHTRASTGRELKVPYAVSPNNGFRVDFKAQAVYDHHAELSLWLDIREKTALQKILHRGADFGRGRNEGLYLDGDDSIRGNPVKRKKLKSPFGPPISADMRKWTSKPKKSKPAKKKLKGNPSELQSYYDSVSTGQWAQRSARRCPCRGSGWMLSDLDTWHKCPAHYVQGQHDPRDYEGEEGGCDCGQKPCVRYAQEQLKKRFTTLKAAKKLHPVRRQEVYEDFDIPF